MSALTITRLAVAVALPAANTYLAVTIRQTRPAQSGTAVDATGGLR